MHDAEMAATDTITVTINDEKRALPPASSVADLLAGLGLDRRKVAVERNAEIVPRGEYATTRLESGDRLEIVHFIGGG
jgi:sulfur carrier protein